MTFSILLSIVPPGTGRAPDPEMNPPPWIHTITGSRSCRVFAGVHTLR